MDLAQIDGLRHPGARNLPTKEPPKHTGSRGVGCRERCLRGSNASSPSRGTQYPPEDAAGRCAMDQQHESQSPSAKIATSAVQVLHEYTGRGPTKAKTTIDESVVTILLADTLTTGATTSPTSSSISTSNGRRSCRRCTRRCTSTRSTAPRTTSGPRI